jgi:peptidoglycan/LPS O-acetylase OafA/YrhL
MQSAKKRPPVQWLDGLRGLAILLVATGHFFNEYYFFTWGWVGVNLFFILSGYLITGRLYEHLAEEGGRRYFKNFYGRRALRIFPIYYGCLIVFFIVLPHVYHRYFIFFGDLYKNQWWFWSYLDNWQIVLYGLPANFVLFIYWSLAVEEQFYLIWPLLFKYTVRVNRKAVIIAIWAISVTARAAASQPSLAYFSTLTAAEPLLMGAMLTVLEREGQLQRYGKLIRYMVALAMLVLIVNISMDNNLTFTNGGLMRWGYTCINILLAALLYRMAVPGGSAWRMRRIFSAKWLQWLGKYSYGIYIYHSFILLILVEKAQGIWTAHGWRPLVAYFLSRAAGIVLLLACAYASYNIFEKKFLRLKRYFA